MQCNNQDSNNELVLFTPESVNVAERVRRAICKQDVSHRGDDFNCLLKGIEDKPPKHFESRNNINYRAVVITGSGTSANESIISLVVSDKNTLLLSKNGGMK